MDFIALENLKIQAIKSFANLDTELARVRKDLAELATQEAKKTFTQEHRTQKEASIRARAREIGGLQRTEAMNLVSRLAVTKAAWDTTTLLKRARFFPAGEKIEHEIAEELKRLRLGSEVRDMTATELVELAQDARQTNSLATLQMLKKESDRRMYESDAERALVKVEVNKAIAEVEPEGQKHAQALIAETERTLEHVEDAISELLTGQQTQRARMREVIAGQANRDDGA